MALTVALMEISWLVLCVAAVLALSIGSLLGVLGGGGAILTLPMLVYVLHVEPRLAIALSLLIVALTSLISTVIHARSSTAVRWRIGVTFGAAAMLAAFAAGSFAHAVPAKLLMILFGLVMLASATAMLRSRSKSRADAASSSSLSSSSTQRRPHLARILVLGLFVGGLSGLVGAGGGFLIVPALTLIGGLAIREAIGTSLLVITMQSLAGFAGHVVSGSVGGLFAPQHRDQLLLIGVVLAASVFGAILGSRASKHIATEKLRPAFAALVLAMAVVVIAKAATS